MCYYHVHGEADGVAQEVEGAEDCALGEVDLIHEGWREKIYQVVLDRDLFLIMLAWVSKNTYIVRVSLQLDDLFIFIYLFLSLDFLATCHFLLSQVLFPELAVGNEIRMHLAEYYLGLSGKEHVMRERPPNKNDKK